MVQNWLLSYRIVINSINTGIKELNCFGVRVCGWGEYAAHTHKQRQTPARSPLEAPGRAFLGWAVLG